MSKRLKDEHKLREKTAKSIGRRKDPEFLRFSNKLDSGYTYLGQFISHEITPITDVYRASRKVTGTMDLESLYGNRENYQLQHIGADDLLFDAQGCFKFSASGKLDFQRNARGVAVIPEQRNDDHVIIAQLHMFWQRLHNLLIKKHFAADALAAKKLVVLTFQLMVVEDYLAQVNDTAVYQQMIGKANDFVADDAAPWRDVFRFATFRFGHSTIRNSYSLRLVQDDPRPSRDLNQLFMSGREPREIELDDYIDWRAFFCLQGKDQFEGVMPVDTCISGFMTDIPVAHAKGGGGIGIHIAKRNIESELAADLPSGIEIANIIEQQLPASIKPDFALLTTDSIGDAAFNHLGLEIEDLTIWLYILLEAQLTEEPHKLGVVASCVNIHVIKQAIEQASFSIYQQGHYDFDKVADKLGDWGGVLKSFASQHKKGGSKLQMRDLVNYLTDNE